MAIEPELTSSKNLTIKSMQKRKFTMFDSQQNDTPEQRFSTASQAMVSKKRRTLICGAVSILVLLAASYAGYRYVYKGAQTPVSMVASKPGAPEDAGSAPSADRVVAVVNGQNITEVEVTSAGVNGAVSRAQLIDDYANKILMAQEYSNHASPEVTSRIARATREIQSEGWLRDTSQKIQGGLTDEEFKSVYEKEVKDTMFAKYKLSFVRGATAEEAEAQNKDWTPLKTNKAEEWITPDEIPYQMGNLVASLKKGDATQTSIAVRDGFLRIRVDDIKEGKKPSFEEMKPRITEVLVGRKLQLALQELRGRADIRIK
jgi:peptidyl-prolyl cis-trans isomerase C